MLSKSIEIPSAKFPEQVGLDSLEIEALLEDYKQSEIELHSLMLYRHGKLGFECHAAPFGRDVPHTMFSVSKSFISIAVGFAVDEGLFSLDSKVIDFFPELRPEKEDENLEAMTVRHLLTMTAGKKENYLADKSKDTWVADFINEKWDFAPGEKFSYINQNPYMCGAIIKKVTGLGVIDYLMPRLFEPLGISRPKWECDPGGQESGGWGLFISPYDLSKVALCVLNGGQYAGKQIIPADYIEQAITKQVDNSENTNADSVCGYGYYFWQNRMENTARMDGMFSQFAVFFRDYDALLVCTCSEVKEQKTRDCIFRHFPQMFIGNKRKQPEFDRELKLSLDPMPVLEAAPRSVMEQQLKGKVMQLRKNTFLNTIGFPTSMLPIAVVFMSSEKSGNINNVVLDFGENECTLAWDEGKDHNMIVCGMDGTPRRSPYHLGGMDYTAVASAAWKAENELEIWVRPLESIAERRLRFVFSGKSVTIYPESSPSSNNMGSGVSDSVSTVFPDSFEGPITSIMSNIDFILDAPIKGKIS